MHTSRARGTATRQLLLALVSALVLMALVPPRPPVIGPATGRDGMLRLSPAVSRVEAAAGTGTELPLSLENSSEERIEVSLDAADVVPGAAGEPVLAEAASGAATWVSFAGSRVVLPPASIATITAAVNVPPDAVLPAVVAVVARSGDGDPDLVAFVAIDETGGTPRVAVTVEVGRDGGTAFSTSTLTNAGDAAAIVWVRTDVQTWYRRTLVDTTTGPLLVSAGAERSVRTTYRAPVVPGRFTARTVVRAGDLIVRGSAGGVLWNPAAGATVVAIALLALTATFWLRAGRPRPAGGAASPPDDRPQS